MEKLQQNLQTTVVAVEILADQWITLENVYVYPSSLGGLEGITKFAAVIRSRLVSQRKEVSRPVQSKFLLRGEYLVAGRETQTIGCRIGKVKPLKIVVFI